MSDTPNTYDQGPEEAITSAVGKLFLHGASRNLYGVIGYSWDSERERWALQYRRLIRGAPGKLQQPFPSAEDAKDDVGPDGRKATAYFGGHTFTHLPEDFHREGRFLWVDI